MNSTMNEMNGFSYPSPKQEYQVLVRCFTFNHSSYIEEALNGFAMQQTNFPFACLVMDDASTDGEQHVIKAWMNSECDMNKAENIDLPTSHVIIVPHKTNKSCTFAFYLLKQNLYGTIAKKMNHVYPWRKKSKYEAMCEGDDYWTDPLKLQKQVDFLESHPDYVMCSHRFKIFEQDLSQMRNDWCGDVPSKGLHYGLNTLVHGYWYHQTLSVVYRLEAFNIEEYRRYPLPKDATLCFYLLKKGKGYLFPDFMAVYRRHAGGLWAGNSVKANFSADFKNRIGIYEIEQSYEAALFIRSLFKRRIPRVWMVQEWNLMSNVFKIISKHFGLMSTLKLFLFRFIFNRYSTY